MGKLIELGRILTGRQLPSRPEIGGVVSTSRRTTQRPVLIEDDFALSQDAMSVSFSGISSRPTITPVEERLAYIRTQLDAMKRR